MKKLLLALLMTPFLVSGATLTFVWIPNATSENILVYKLYEHVGASYTLLGSTANTNLVITNVLAGQHFYTITSSNVWGESIKAPEVSTPSLPNTPTNITINISAAFQGSITPLGPWEDLELTHNIRISPLYSFYRVKTRIER